MNKTITIPCDRYDMVYVKNENGKYLDSYIPHDGYSLFVVGATYAKSLNPSKYYVIARNAREARAIFKNRHGDILSYIKFVEQIDYVYQDYLLNNYLKHPVIVI